ncbi:hypothetical protein PUN28_002083 [Cardiocondyla obscurior]|uniref:Uncharacterized protein n=1 Tax=Cardiocondyla obscurior TaxID=286306 RepID=A0AAW2GSH6_9HYME
MNLFNSVSASLRKQSPSKFTDVGGNSKTRTATKQRYHRKLANISATLLVNEQLSICGASIMYCPQLMKISDTIATAMTWCCTNQLAEPWITNRNARQSIPA